MSDRKAVAVQQHRRGAVLELVIDNPPVNALGHAVRAGLEQGIAAAEADPAVHAILIRAAGRTFPAGADITEFDEQARAPFLADLCDRIEACPKPVVAAIHGTALGGGLELALACHARIARADALVGLPEVSLGVLPGAGGTQRTPRLIGAEQALRLMLTGKPIPAAEALALGLIDRVVEDGLDQAALAMAEGMVGQAPVPTRDRREGLRDAVAYQRAVAAARKAHEADRLPGTARIVDCVEAAQLLPFDQGLAFERAAFLDLVASPEAAGLRHAFFAERAATRFPEARVPPREVQVCGVMGAAGADLALLLLQAGFRVTLAETDRPRLVGALEQIAAEQEAQVAAGRLSPEARDADWARLTPALDCTGLADADLVLIVDGPSLPAVAQATRPGAVLALTAQGTGITGPRAADLLGLSIGPHEGRLAEVIVAAATAPEATATLVAVLRRLRRMVVRVKAPGGLGSAVMAAGRAAATHLVARGVPAGDVAGALADFGLPGLLAGPDPVPPSAPIRETVLTHVLSAMANEGARQVGKGVALRCSDVDLAVIGGHGFPRWEGGPMHWADARGLLILRRDLRLWQKDAPELWSVAPLIDGLATSGQSFAAFDRA